MSTTTYGPYAAHPLADKLPLIEGEAFDAMVASITKSGQQVLGLVSADGERLIDGRNRYRACAKAGVAFQSKRMPDGSTAEDEIAAVSAGNERRHMSTGERAMFGVEVEAAYSDAAKARQGTRTDLQPSTENGEKFGDRSHHSRERAARDVGVAPSSIGLAKEIVRDAPDLADEVRAGTKKLGTAHREMKERQAKVIPIDGRSSRKSEAERIAEIAPRAARGESSRQIADALGIGRKQVVDIASGNGIEIHADAIVGRSHRIDSMRVARATAEQIIACSAGLGLINFDDLDPAEAATWVTPMRKSLAELKRFADRVAACREQNKEMTQ